MKKLGLLMCIVGVVLVVCKQPHVGLMFSCVGLMLSLSARE